jgi:hypothetical protein
VSDHKQHYKELWYWYLTGEHQGGFSRTFERRLAMIRRVSGLPPGQPRCLVSEVAAAGANLDSAERRALTLKGMSEPVGVRIVKNLARADHKRPQ